MPRNVEVKARARVTDVRRAVERLGAGHRRSFGQVDTFFRVARGRLKLRRSEGRPAQLIFYERTDAAGPRPSSYRIVEPRDADRAEAVLAKRLGVLGTVRKTRTLYLVGQTRVHLDEVDGLGEFVELEVVLRGGQTEGEGARIARGLMAALGIEECHLVECAYVDLLCGGRDAAR